MAWVTARVSRALRHLARIRYRLLLINLLVAAVPLVGIGFAEMHERQLLDALERDMIHQAQLVRALVQLDHGARPLADLQPALVTAARDTRTRIRLLDATGSVRADSHRGAPVPLATRREIRAALAGRYGSATRLWRRQERVYLFSALPILSRHGAVEGVVYVTRSTREVKLQLYELRHWLVKLLIGTMIATALLSLVFATTIARPLGKLTRRAQRIATRQPGECVGPPDATARRADEIGHLARAIDAMTAELERRAKDARTLAADISHEFKTPLTGIRGAAELLADGAADEPDARARFLAMIIDDTARLDRLVSRLLELARIDDDRSAVQPVDLGALARACARRSWPLPVTVRCADESSVSGREAALASALENLIVNATQHAAPGTPIQILVERTTRTTRITVENHGPAVSPAARSKVWDRFYSTRATDGGTGLGLAIVRSVALAHGGSVGVDSADGVTAFWFEVPNQGGSRRS